MHENEKYHTLKPWSTDWRGGGVTGMILFEHVEGASKALFSLSLQNELISLNIQGTDHPAPLPHPPPSPPSIHARLSLMRDDRDDGDQCPYFYDNNEGPYYTDERLYF